MSNENKKEKPNYHKSGPELHAQARLFHRNGMNDQPALVVADPQLTDLWFDAFLDDIMSAEAMPTVQSAVNEMKVATESVKNLMKTGRRKMQDLFIYAKRAMPGSPAILDSFGKRQYKSASTNAIKLCALMRMAKEKITEESVALAAAGFGPAQVTAFTDALNNLEAKQTEQAGLANDVGTVGDIYIRRNNLLWAQVQKIHDAAAIAFADDYARFSNYLLYPEVGSRDLTYYIDVPPGNAPVFHRYQDVLPPDQSIEFKMVAGAADATICFSLSDSGECTGTPMTLAMGSTATFSYSEFTVAGQFLRIQQPGPVVMRVRVTLL